MPLKNFFQSDDHSSASMISLADYKNQYVPQFHPNSECVKSAVLNDVSIIKKN